MDKLLRRSRPGHARARAPRIARRRVGASSDYDLIRVVTDERYERGPVHEKSGDADVLLQTPSRLERLAGPMVSSESRLLRLVGAGDPSFQQELETKVETLVDSGGFAHDWGSDLEPLRALSFA